MAVALHSYKIDRDGVIRVRHTFYGATEEACENEMEEHAEGCAAYGPALDEGETIEIFEENVPAPDVEALEAVADEQQGDEEDEAEEIEE